MMIVKKKQTDVHLLFISEFKDFPDFFTDYKQPGDAFHCCFGLLTGSLVNVLLLFVCLLIYLYLLMFCKCLFLVWFCFFFCLCVYFVLVYSLLSSNRPF